MHLDRLLGDGTRAWREATQRQRNRLAGSLFTEMVIKDNQITAANPCPELAGFFEFDCIQRGLSPGKATALNNVEGCKWAEVTGLEPAVSALTGQRVNHYTTPPRPE